jgi:murein L,D-transpeptidase YcbB/YkuD
MIFFKILTICLVAMWFIACAHMESQDQAKTKKEKPAETTSESETPQTETDESNALEPQEKSQGSQSSTQVQSQLETESEMTPSKAAEAKLEEAREKLRNSRETEERIAADLEQLKKSGDASPEAIEDYEEYQSRVRAMTAENRKILEQMEAAYDRHDPDATYSGTAVPSDSDKIYDPSILEEKTVDEVAALDREFNESLAQFDDKLLKEMDEIRANSDEKLQDLAQEAAEAAKRLRDKGVDVDTSGSESTETAGGPKEESDKNRQAQTTGDSADTEKASREGSLKEGQGASADDRRRADYGDDDIVARQLREAAENETDPELKEKLWKEYEDYKNSER